ncbi:uncharacterized protein N7482_010086, partial [Penicillium canariense]
MALKSCITVLAISGLVTANSSVVSLFIPGADPQPLAASIVKEGAGTTTYSINCPPGTDGSDCGMGPGMWYTSASKSIEWSMSEPAVGLYLIMTDSWGGVVCSVGGTTTAVCTEIMSGTGANFPGTSTIDVPQSELTYLPVTVTAGPASATSASTTTESTGSALTSSNTHSSANTASPTSKASSTTVASHTSTAGLSRVTGNPGVALGGAAAAFIAAA